MTFRTIFECDECGKQIDAETMGATYSPYAWKLPKDWFGFLRAYEETKIHLCSKECVIKYFSKQEG